MSSTSTEIPPAERRTEEEGEEIIDDEDEEEEEEVEDEEDDVEEEDDDDEGDHPEITVGRRSGRGLTLKTLLKERVLEPGEGSMTINYLGNKFKGDLLPDGRIRSQETNKIFGTPSAWAIYCKKIVNPDKKSGCGWASVRYRGKKLDTYKNNWYRQKRLEYEKEEEEMEEEVSESESEETSPHEQEILEFDLLGNRNPNHDPSAMVELGTFQAIGRMQPFNITMSSSAMAVIDVHAHLTTSEVVGYLAGQWDVNNHNLIVSHAFPVRCRLGDSEKGPSVEQELYAEMARLKLSLVGWYHTHPSSPPLPTLRDIDSQLDYEMKMKGYNDASYTPVLGIIVSPYQKSPIHDKGIPHPNGNATGFWVMPPAENKPLEYGRPMSMQFTVVQDAFIPKEALLHMSEVVKYYKDAPDAVELLDIFEEKFTYWHKLKSSLKGRVPKDHYQPLIDFLTKVIDKKLPEDDPAPPPPPKISTPSSTNTSTSTTNATVISTPNLPPSTSLSMVEGKGSPSILGEQHLSSTKDLESCVANILKCSMGADLSIASSSHSDIGSSKERESVVSLPPYSSTSEEEQPSSSSSSSNRPKSVEGRTPPPKSYSPLFQLPLPPLFSMESNKTKESQPLKASYHPLNLQMEDKKQSDFPFKSRSSGRSEKQSIEESLMGIEAVPRSSKYDLHSSSTFLDLHKERKSSEESRKERESSKIGSVDVPAWFAQAKLMQEAFSLPPHERDNPFGRSSSPATHRDIPPLFPSEFLSPHWNPSLKASYHPSLSLSTDSKPTYHSDVPLLLKKQQEESLKEAKSSQRDLGHEAKEAMKKSLEETLLQRDFRMPPPDYKEAKESKELRDLRDPFKKSRDMRDRVREMRNPYEEREREFKEPKIFRGESSSKESREEKLAHSIRDIHEMGRRDIRELKDSYFDRLESASPKDFSRETKEPKEVMDLYRDKRETSKDYSMKEPRDPREASKDHVEVRDPRDMRDHRSLSGVDIREINEHREARDHRSEGTLREEAKDLRKAFEAPEGKTDQRDISGEPSVSMSDVGSLKDSSDFRGIGPMDMTFKIKRDTHNPDGRHFIESMGIKRHQEQQPMGISEANRNILSYLDANRGAKDTVINLSGGANVKDHFESALQHDLSKERMDGSFHSMLRNVVSDVSEVKSHEQKMSSESTDSIPKGVINLRDPKTLYEPREYRESKEDDRGFAHAQRRLFPGAEEGEGSEAHSSTSSVFVPHRTSPDEPMDYE